MRLPQDYLKVRHRLLPYNPRLKQIARVLRSNMTVAEILIWNRLKGKRLFGCDFHRQKPIDEFIVDFYCPNLFLAIEIDGDSHEGKLEKDGRRQREIEKFGVHFLRFPDEEVKRNFDGVVRSIEDWIENQSELKRSQKGRKQHKD
jgi:very-short-patch-repair endonuclease